MNGRRTVFGLGGWVLLVGGAAGLGAALEAAGRRTYVRLPPLYGELDPVLTAWVLVPAAVAGLAVAAGPQVARSVSWRPLLVATFLTAVAWAVSLALVRGPDALTDPLLGPWDYLRSLPLAQELGPRAFLNRFTSDIARYTTHVQGHPPGFLLLLWGLDAIGLGGAGWAAVLVIAAGASAAPAALVALREVADEERARRAAPFLAVVPAAVWIATSADALYMGVAAWGIAALTVSTGRLDGRGDALALAGGLLIGLGLFGTYGLAPVGAVALAVALARRRVRPLVVGSAGVAAVFVAFMVFGFWWFEGLATTIAQYHAGVASRRPWGYFVVANPAAFAIAVGPAVAVALARLRDRRVWLLVGAGLIAVAAADLSGLSKGEVERIWLPFAPWILVACATFDAQTRTRLWLGLQATTGAAVTVLVATPW